MRRFPTPPLLFTLLLALSAPTGPARGGENWPEFRGPGQQGHSDSTGLPAEWSEAKNVKWKTPIPGQGWSSPVIWGDQVWLTTATDEGKSLRAVCVDKNTGKVVHDVELFRPEALDPKNSFNSFASPTPVLEEGRVYVSFGNYGNACLDSGTGGVIWKTQELKLEHKEGPGSSPILYKNFYVLHCDGMDVQYVAALDKATGKLAWKTDRKTDFGTKPPDLKKAYCVPLVVNVNGKDQLISPGAFRVMGYDPETGKELWSCATPGFSTVPRPVFGHGMAYVCTGYMQAELFAIRPEGSGDVTGTHVVWRARQGVPFKPSLMLVGDGLYMVSDNGIARCLDARTGEEVWKKRLDGNFTASPVYADGKIYFPSEEGRTFVIRPGKTFEQVAENELEGRLMASPAVSGKALFLRTDKALYRIEEGAAAK